MRSALKPLAIRAEEGAWPPIEFRSAVRAAIDVAVHGTPVPNEDEAPAIVLDSCTIAFAELCGRSGNPRSLVRLHGART
jgi:hypothetical protein